MKQFIYLIILCSIGISACRKDIAPDNPCANAQEISADFAIEAAVGDRYFEGDTIYDLNLVRFRAKQQLDEYKWVLGAETLSTQAFSRTSFPKGTWLTLSLMVKSKTNSLCFPEDNGIDTLAKRFYVWPSNPIEKVSNQPPTVPPFPIYGTYLGYKSSNPNKLVYVTLQDTFWLDDNNEPYYVGVVKGIPYDKTNSAMISRTFQITDFIAGFSPLALQVSIRGWGELHSEWRIPRTQGYAWLDKGNRNKITIEYQYADTLPNDFIDLKFNDTFKGIRVY
jgi:hypothetical protein